jgi:ABC-type multidrug transport system ATPase subunit
VFGFLGQNGAGKSTTIRMLLTLISPSAGEIRIFGKELRAHREEILHRTGAVIEQPELYPYLSGYENLRLFARMGAKDPGRKALMDMLEKVGLATRAKDPVRAYSQGMKQRLGIAVALVQDPPLVILDEPTNGLDPQGIVDIRNLILTLNREQGKTFLVSSHLLGEVELVASRMLIIDRGQKVVEGAVRDLINPDRVMLDLETTDMAKSRNLIDQSKWSGAQKPSGPDRILLDLPKEEVPVLAAMLVQEGIGLRSMKAVNTLEAYFLSLTNTPGDVEPR